MRRPIQDAIKAHCKRRKVNKFDLMGPGVGQTKEMQREKRYIIRALYRWNYSTSEIARALQVAHSNVSYHTRGLKRREQVLTGTNKGDA